MPVVFINTTKAEFDGDFLKDINEIVSDDKEIKEGRFALYSKH